MNNFNQRQKPRRSVIGNNGKEPKKQKQQQGKVANLYGGKNNNANESISIVSLSYQQQKYISGQQLNSYHGNFTPGFTLGHQETTKNMLVLRHQNLLKENLMLIILFSHYVLNQIRK